MNANSPKTVTLFAALDVAGGQRVSRVRELHRHQEFLDFLRQIDLFVLRCNADASPFKGFATADSILQKVERTPERISATGPGPSARAGIPRYAAQRGTRALASWSSRSSAFRRSHHPYGGGCAGSEQL